MLYDITVTEIKDGKYEIYVPIPMQIQGEDQSLELFRIHPIPLVYQSKVMMQVETNLRVVGVNSKIKHLVFFESIDQFRTKSWDNLGYYQTKEYFLSLSLERLTFQVFLSSVLLALPKLMPLNFTKEE